MPSGHDETSMRDLLRRGKLRVTHVRLAILRALSESEVALEASDVATALRKAGDDADRVTVYRTLNSLVDRGIAHRIDPGDRIFRFSLTDHGRCTDDHHEHEHPHMKCDTCGAVECILDAEVVIKPRDERGGSRRRFKVTQQDIMLHGTCDRCAKGS
jgi:Fur family transcriptional regulator, ferric uptake regulator